MLLETCFDSFFLHFFWGYNEDFSIIFSSIAGIANISDYSSSSANLLNVKLDVDIDDEAAREVSPLLLLVGIPLL